MQQDANCHPLLMAKVVGCLWINMLTTQISIFFGKVLTMITDDTFCFIHKML